MSRSRSGTPTASASSSKTEIAHEEEEGKIVDHRAWTAVFSRTITRIGSRKRLTVFVGVLLFLAAFSAASNVLWAGGPGDDRLATTSTCGEGPPGGGRESGAKRG